MSKTTSQSIVKKVEQSASFTKQCAPFRETILMPIWLTSDMYLLTGIHVVFFSCRYMSFPDDEKILLRSYLQEWYQQVSVSEESFYSTVFDANKTMCIFYIFISESISLIHTRKFFDLENILNSPGTDL